MRWVGQCERRGPAERDELSVGGVWAGGIHRGLMELADQVRAHEHAELGGRSGCDFGVRASPLASRHSSFVPIAQTEGIIYVAQASTMANVGESISWQCANDHWLDPESNDRFTLNTRGVRLAGPEAAVTRISGADVLGPEGGWACPRHPALSV
jgi:hypothetical protein